MRKILHNRWFQWGMTLAILVVLGFVFRDELDFLTEGFRRLRHTSPLPVGVVILASLTSLAAMAEVMRLLLGAGDVRVSPKETTAITLASNALSTTLPAGPAFSAVLTFHVQRQWGAPTVLCGWFLVLSSALSTMWMVLIGLAAVLFLNADMSMWSLLLSLTVTLGVAWAVFWVTSHPRTIERVVARQKWLGDKRDGLIAHVRNLREVHLSRPAFISAAAYSLLHRVADMAALWACVWAVTGEIPWLSASDDHTTLAGVALAFITAKLAGSAQVTPAGLGTVEAAIIATLVACGMTAVDATSAAFVYRLISFALMTLIGWVVYFWHYARKGMTFSTLNLKRKDTGSV